MEPLRERSLKVPLASFWLRFLERAYEPAHLELL
jgi:hypothetical protein